jgi:bifunctional DNA-binding transcriptional regulator/antitoxin component of YhaV-PrlF toxin-antitoxin module
MVIPADIRAKSEILPGEEVIVVSDGPGEIRVMTRKAALRRAQEWVAGLAKPGQSMVDELLEDRRREAAEEL